MISVCLSETSSYRASQSGDARLYTRGRMATSQNAKIRGTSLLPQQGLFRILLIDDHEDTSLLLQTFLERTSGYQVIPALTGAEGLEVALTERLDLIMLDAWLPDIDGLEVCRRIRVY